MAIEVDRLIASLEMRLDKYEKNAAKAVAVSNKQFGAIERRGKQMEASLSRVGANALGGLAKGAIAAVLPVLTLAAAVNRTKQALAAFGEIADQSAATGFDPESYQALTYQFSLFGVSAEQSAGALASFAKNAGLAAAGKGRMFTALKTLNPELLENVRQARSQEERIRLVADALGKEENAARRAAVATALFGDSGSKIATAFEGGAAAMDATMRKARELGLVVDRDLIAKADELGDEFDTATQIIDIQLKQALVNLAPVLTWLSGLAADLTRQFNLAVDGMKGTEGQQLSTLEAQLSALRAARDMPNPFGLPRDIFGTDAAKIKELEKEIFRRGEGRSMTLLGSSAAPPDDIEIPTLDEIEALNKSVGRLHSSYDAWADDGVQNLIDKHKELADTISGEIVGGIRSIWDAYKSGENVLDAILGKVMGIGEQMLFGGLQSLLSGGLGGGLGGGWNIPTSHVRGGFFPAFRASGGPVQAGKPYVVGERRPELFVPSSAGRIEPRVPPSMGGGGGQVNNFYIDAKGAEIGVETKIVRAIQTMVPPMIKSQSPAAVGQASRDRVYG